MRLWLAAGVLVLTAGAHAAPAARLRPAPSVAIVHAKIVSGNPQTAQAFASTAATTFVTEFPAVLVVAVDAAPLEGEIRRVRFRCVSRGCTLAPAEQPNADAIHAVWNAPRKRQGEKTPGKLVLDPAAKDADLDNGRASIRIAIEAARPDATYTVTATPIVQAAERTAPVSFTLTSR